MIMGAVQKVSSRGLVATLHLPDRSGPHPALIVLGGSDGGLQSANLFGGPLAANGFGALCLAYFAMEGLPATLSAIPLEYFERAVDWLRAHPAIDRSRVGVLGSSRGGEAALLVGATIPAVKVVVANVPSHVVWAGMAADGHTSSWTAEGAGLPFASLVSPRVGSSWREWFDASLAAAPAASVIPVERTQGAILFISGTDDGIWPSSTMADLSMSRLRACGFPFPAEHARYEGAGHVVLTPPYQIGPIDNPWPSDSYSRPGWMSADGPPLTMGGSSERNRLARIDAWPTMLRFLQHHI
jgi:dienelactone hydrolase